MVQLREGNKIKSDKKREHSCSLWNACLQVWHCLQYQLNFWWRRTTFSWQCPQFFLFRWRLEKRLKDESLSKTKTVVFFFDVGKISYLNELTICYDIKWRSVATVTQTCRCLGLRIFYCNECYRLKRFLLFFFSVVLEDRKIDNVKSSLHHTSMILLFALIKSSNFDTQTHYPLLLIKILTKKFDRVIVLKKSWSFLSTECDINFFEKLEEHLEIFFLCILLSVERFWVKGAISLHTF